MNILASGENIPDADLEIVYRQGDLFDSGQKYI